MADGNPFASMLNPNAARTGLWDMRMMSAANRMETPFERGARGMYRGRGVSGDPMLAGLAGMANEPDYSQFTNDPRAQAAARQALAPYGLAPLEARDVKSNVLLPNTGFFGSHPRLSGALEGGIFGAAAAHGGETPGESIQGALEGMIGGQRIRRGLYNQQFARPFEAAGMIEGLTDARQRRELQAADIEHLRAVNEHLKNGDFEKAQQLQESNRHQEAVEAWRAQQIESSAPRNLGEGRIGVYHPENLPPEGKPIDPTKPLWEVQQDPEWQKEYSADRRAQRSAMGGGPWYTYTDKKTGKKVYGRAEPGQQVPEGVNYIQGDYPTKEGDKLKEHRAAWLGKDRKPSELIGMGYNGDLTDGKARQKFLENFYDQNIAPAMQDSPAGFTRNPDGSYSER